jgi:hypothetical protein
MNCLNCLKCMLTVVLFGPACSNGQVRTLPQGQSLQEQRQPRPPSPAPPAPSAQGGVDDAEITSNDGFNNLCPGKTYSYGIKKGNDVGAIDSASLHWTAYGGNGTGYDQPTFKVQWLGSGAVDIDFDFTSISDGTLHHAHALQPIWLEPPPSVAKPLIAGATALNPDYIPPGVAATVTTASPWPVSKYTWTAPSCFVTASLTTQAPTINFTKTGTCAGQVCVSAVSQACAQQSQQVCSTVKRIPQLPPIQGPNAVCKSSSATYCVDPIKGVDAYAWTVPAGWIFNGVASTGQAVSLLPDVCVSLAAPASLTANQAGTLTVQGVLNAISAHTAALTKTVTLEVGLPQDLAKTSPIITVDATPTAGKKRITVAFQKLSFPFRWSGKVTGSGAAVSLDAPDGGARTFMMMNNELLSLETRTENSCGKVPANSYAYRLKNGAMVPVELQ